MLSANPLFIAHPSIAPPPSAHGALREDHLVLTRRIGVLLAREGFTMNHKKLRRLYREEGLAVKRRRGRKRSMGSREAMSVPSGRLQRWSLDFLSDVFGPGRRFRILAVIDDFTRECLALIADTSISGIRVGRELDALVSRH